MKEKDMCLSPDCVILCNITIFEGKHRKHYFHFQFFHVFLGIVCQGNGLVVNKKGKKKNQEGHDGHVSLNWSIRKIPSYQTLQYFSPQDRTKIGLVKR